jgi:hypothetical protein
MLALLFWAKFGNQSRDLTPDKAATLISARPEFNKYANLISVSRTIRGADSLKDCCYSADFAFLQSGSNKLIPAHAEFRYHGGRWHLLRFWHGEPPAVEMVWVGQNDEPSRR